MDTLDHKNVMTNLNREDLRKVDGGSLTGSLVDAFTNAFKTVLDFGRSLGSAIRRLSEGNVCALK